MAAWVIGYGFIQAIAPRFLKRNANLSAIARGAERWGFILAFVSAGIAVALQFNLYPTVAVLGGLYICGHLPVNSSVHSYLILAYTDSDKVALNVGFYYMANACGRLVGTLLSGVMYLVAGLPGCLWVSTALGRGSRRPYAVAAGYRPSAGCAAGRSTRRAAY